jgi:hypothetical protein
MADRPDWFKILTDIDPPLWSKGPTIPFILGAIRFLDVAPPSRATGQIELRGLLRRMEREAPPHYGVCITPCPSAGHIVVAHGNSLTWDPYDFPNIATVDALTGRLWSLYGDQISEGKYSINRDGKWHTFEPPEISAIRAALGIEAQVAPPSN